MRGRRSGDAIATRAASGLLLVGREIAVITEAASQPAGGGRFGGEKGEQVQPRR